VVGDVQARTGHLAKVNGTADGFDFRQLRAVRRGGRGGRRRPAASIRFSRRAMIEGFSACTTQTPPRRARISKPSSIAPSDGAGKLPEGLLP